MNAKGVCPDHTNTKSARKSATFVATGHDVSLDDPTRKAFTDVDACSLFAKISAQAGCSGVPRDGVAFRGNILHFNVAYSQAKMIAEAMQTYDHTVSFGGHSSSVQASCSASGQAAPFIFRI